MFSMHGVLSALELWPFFHSQHGSHRWNWLPQGFAHLLQTTPEIERAVRETTRGRRRRVGRVHAPSTPRSRHQIDELNIKHYWRAASGSQRSSSRAARCTSPPLPPTPVLYCFASYSVLCCHVDLTLAQQLQHVAERLPPSDSKARAATSSAAPRSGPGLRI